ncbi:copper homeostasis protein, partial [Psychrobacter sp. 16-Bac2893]
MINFSPVFSASSLNNRCLRLLLAVPVCIALVSCDSASSSTNKNTQGAPINSDQSNVLNNEEPALEDNSAKALANEDSDQEGQALIAAANANDNSARSPMISAANSDSMLQATLMGDYGGVVP